MPIKKPLTKKNIQKAMNTLCQVDSEMQIIRDIGQTTILQVAHELIINAWKLLDEERKNAPP